MSAVHIDQGQTNWLGHSDEINKKVVVLPHKAHPFSIYCNDCGSYALFILRYIYICMRVPE